MRFARKQEFRESFGHTYSMKEKKCQHKERRVEICRQTWRLGSRCTKVSVERRHCKTKKKSILWSIFSCVLRGVRNCTGPRLTNHLEYVCSMTLIIPGTDFIPHKPQHKTPTLSGGFSKPIFLVKTGESVSAARVKTNAKRRVY